MDPQHDLTAFSEDYFEAREKFRQACRAAGLEVRSYPCPEGGPRGQALSVETGYLGPEGPASLFVTVSGVHGVEGLAGSGCQIDLIRSAILDPADADCGILFVHCLNPYGAAWCCTETHENIDLNRNFLDFSETLPHNPDYPDVHGFFACPEIAGPLREKTDAELDSYIETKGLDAFLGASASGQYAYPDGLSFGGHRPAWSNDVLRRCLETYGASASRVAVVDYHTGLGPWGQGTVIVGCCPESDTGKRMREAFDPPIIFAAGGDVGYRVAAGLDRGCAAALPAANVLAVTLEFGTCDIMQIIDATRDRIWLSRFGEFDSEAGRKIARALCDAYYVQSPEWRKMILARSRQVAGQCFATLDLP